jgi:hypothetical protein
MPALIRLWVAASLLMFALCGLGRDAPADAPAQLLDHLAGRWVMSGTIDGKQTTHDVDADWVLKREYIRLHEVSREKDGSGGAAYEAIVFLSWNSKTGEYSCLWLDNTAGGALSPEGIAHGKPAANAIPLVFAIRGKEAMHTTFLYDAHADNWRLTIDDVTSGKSERFADVRLARVKQR